VNIPTSRDLLHPMLQVAVERSSVSEGELHHFLAFTFGCYEGGPAVGGPGGLRRFDCRVRVARRALLRYGLLVSGGGDDLIITPHGEAYLTTGWLRTRSDVSEAAVRVGHCIGEPEYALPPRVLAGDPKLQALDDAFKRPAR
jgi:hypothetical protein